MSDQQSKGIRASGENSDGLLVCHIGRINIIHLCVHVCVHLKPKHLYRRFKINANERYMQFSTHTEDAIPRPQFTHPSSNTVWSHLDMTTQHRRQTFSLLSPCVLY